MTEEEQVGPIISEKGRNDKGEVVYSDRRIYMQLLVFTGVSDEDALTAALSDSDLQGVLYRDVNDPQGVALLTASVETDFFPGPLRTFLRESAFNRLSLKDEMTMIGRSYTIGYESDLDHVLVNRPLFRITNPDWPWAIWYPLRRSGAFSKLDQKEQNEILMEHGRIGMSFGEADYAHDIRLACHGLDRNDNDFLIGLLGKDLYPLSAVVQTMRKTRQTSEFLTSLGPFFVGKVIWQSQPGS
ncbi:MAG: chlorite dismutase family protein [Verrucomicrobiota bacterium]